MPSLFQEGEVSKLVRRRPYSHVFKRVKAARARRGVPVERAQQHVPQPLGRRVLRKQQLAAARACKRVGRRSAALVGRLEGWRVASKRLEELPRIERAPWAVAVAGRAVGHCRCRGRPSSQPA